MIFLLLFWEFFKIGMFTFGGGLGMIPLVRDIVLQYNWLTESEFYDFIGICESTPGPIAVNVATYIGTQQGGFFGAVCATLGVVLPSFIIIILVASILTNFLEKVVVKRALKGLKISIVALITGTALIMLLKETGYISLDEFVFDLKSVICLALITIIYLVFKFVFHKKMSAIMIILVSACLGIVVCLF